jgi:RNA polymerase sigma-B factor
LARRAPRVQVQGPGQANGRPAGQAHRIERAKVRALFRRLRKTRDGATRETLILAHERLAFYLTQRFLGRGQPAEDVIQTARIGLIKAVDRFDARRGVEFTTYATPTIVGEIRRYFRDTLWSVHVPRRLREMNNNLIRTVERLTQRLMRPPTIVELARETGLPHDAVRQALDVANAYNPVSLDAVTTEEQHNPPAFPLLQSIGQDDPGLAQVEDRLTLKQALAKLPHREQEIMRLTFYERMPQAAIARRLGISQMHVSRLRRRALSRLRALILH